MLDEKVFFLKKTESQLNAGSALIVLTQNTFNLGGNGLQTNIK